MSMFRLIKYSSIIYFLGKHRSKLFRSLAVLLFAFVTSLIYEDIRIYLQSQHPESLIYALGAKILIVYGSLAFVLWQFRPTSSSATTAPETSETEGSMGRAADRAKGIFSREQVRPKADSGEFDRLNALSDLEQHDRLTTRYERVLNKTGTRPDSVPEERKHQE